MPLFMISINFDVSYLIWAFSVKVMTVQFMDSTASLLNIEELYLLPVSHKMISFIVLALRRLSQALVLLYIIIWYTYAWSAKVNSSGFWYDIML